MRATALRFVLALALVGSIPARADTHSEIADVLANMTGALTDSNAAAFMSAIDKRKCPDYGKLATQISELLQQGSVSSSVEFLKDEGGEARRAVELDWYLSLQSGSAAGPLTERRKVIDCVFEKEGRKWKIVSISPISFFAPQIYR